MVDFEEHLPKYLSEKRLAHSKGTARTAVKLAEIFKADVKKAHIAGMLHDIAKGLSDEALLNAAQKYGILADEVEVLNAQLLHGKVAAYMAREEFGIVDEDILNSISYHTTGRIGMSKLEKIIYVADFIEPTRNFEGIDELREAAEKSLDKAVLACAKQCMSYVIKKGCLLHQNTVNVYNDMLKKENSCGTV